MRGMSANMPEFEARLSATAAEVEALLSRLLDDKPLPGEIARPARLVRAMRHAVLGGGKRLRPFLLVESAALFGVNRDSALLAGSALECVHVYSLVHDDLPAMDNDDLRRGRPTSHKVYGEAMAILVGDGLQALAFEILAGSYASDPALQGALLALLAHASGSRGMVGGQAIDIGSSGMP